MARALTAATPAMLAEVNGRPDGVSIRWRSPGADHDN